MELVQSKKNFQIELLKNCGFQIYGTHYNYYKYVILILIFLTHFNITVKD